VAPSSVGAYTQVGAYSSFEKLSSGVPNECIFHGQVIAGPNPTIASYNASVVNFYNATGSLVCFENKNIFL
jgi:hypothetical protein